MSDVITELAMEASDKAMEITRLRAENTKLWRMVMDYNYCILHVDCAMCKYKYGGTMSEHCPLSPCFPDIDELRELGVDE